MNFADVSGGGETPSGALWSTELRAKGIGRFFGAAFLGVWLCGWFVGECFAVTMLGGIALKILNPEFLAQLGAKNIDVPAGAGAAFIVGFLMLWLTLWTFGGIAAISQFLRQLGGVDTIELYPSALVVRRRAVIGLGTTRIPIEKVMDLRIVPRGGLVAVTMGKQITLSDLGSPDEKTEVRVQLEPRIRSLRSDTRPAGDRLSDQLPNGWRDASGDLAMTGDSSGFSTVIVSQNPARMGTMIFMAIIAAIPAWLLLQAIKGMVFIEPGAGGGMGAVIGPLILCAIPALIAAATWTWRREIRVRPGAILSRWSILGHTRARLFESARLEIQYSTDSDGDPWYKLEVWSGNDHGGLAQSSDYAGPLHLGHWLARRLGTELVLPRELRESNGHAA